MKNTELNYEYSTFYSSQWLTPSASEWVSELEYLKGAQKQKVTMRTENGKGVEYE